MADLPTGTVTFLFTDIERSTALWEREPTAMQQAAVRHDALIEAAVTEHSGMVVRPRGEGDSRFAVFARASEAVAAALALQWDLAAEPWPTSTPVRVRVALHTGEADVRDGDYYGTAVNRCARLRAVGHGGQALLSQATAELVRDTLPSGASLQDLGEHRLRDLTRPERLYHLRQPGVSADFPPLRSLDMVPHNLPVQLTSFVGRERELTEIAGLLANHRLVTLTGAGGCGKTRLALQAAADALDATPDGVWLVELAPLSDPDLVPQAVIHALGVFDQPGQPLLTTLVGALAGKRLLLVLDNCEHLLDATATLAEALMRGCPHLRVLATSRELLGVEGEAAWRVPSLAAPTADEMTLDGLRASAAVQLLVERAGLVQPNFTVTAANATALAQICRRLDGMPLAIELAAARLTALSPVQIAARLDDRFRLLTGGRRTAVRRQQTLEAAIDWSHDLLPEAERVLLRRLAVFAGGWTLEAAETVGSGDGLEAGAVLDLLTRLVEKSLVVADDIQDEPRYRLLETVRQYAGDKLLAAREAEAVRDRHLAWAVALAEQAEPALRSAAQLTWARRLDAEHDNIRGAIQWAVAQDEAQLGLRVTGALWHYWEVAGHYREGRAHYEAVLALPGADAPTPARVLALIGVGSMTAQLGDMALATHHFQDAHAVARQLGQGWLIAFANLGLGTIVLQKGGAEQVRHYETSRRIWTELNDAWGVALASGFVAENLIEAGDYAAAESVTRGLVALAQQTGSTWLIGHIMFRSAAVAYYTGDYRRARALAEDGVVLARVLASPRAVATRGLIAGMAALAQADYAAARTWFSASVQVMRDLGNRWGLVDALESLSCLSAQTGQPLRALRLVGAATALRSTLAMFSRAIPIQADLDHWLAPARQALSEAEQAAAWAEGEALTLDEAVVEALAD